MKAIFITLFTMIVLSPLVVAQNFWVQKTSMYDYGRHVAVSFTIENKAYVGLGRIPDGTRMDDFWEYDPTSNIWTKKASFPGGGRYSATAFAINGKGYVCLGLDNNDQLMSDLWEYDPTSNSWLRKANFPGLPRYGASCFTIADSAYIGTGSNGGSDEYLFDLWMYVPITDSWVRKVDFPGYRRSHATAFSIGNEGYLGGGLANSFTPTKDFWKFNPTSNTWVMCSNLPNYLMGSVSFVINNIGYLGLGYDQVKDFNDFYRYDPTTNSWDTIFVDDNIIPRRGSVSFSIGQTSYFCTGETDFGLLADLWAYTPPPPPEFSFVDNTVNQSLRFLIYPNPIKEKMFIETQHVIQNSFLTILNLTGQSLLTYQLDQTHNVVDVSNFPDGFYIAKISSGTRIEVINFIKN
jgi:N-acetylneuraminic acid mutarotase